VDYEKLDGMTATIEGAGEINQDAFRAAASERFENNSDPPLAAGFAVVTGLWFQHAEHRCAGGLLRQIRSPGNFAFPGSRPQPT
jgi:predicted outer membrane lipoprotein